MRKLASIEKIIKIEEIKNADQIELVSILGWKVIVRKEENYKVGDLVIYIEYDSVLPQKPEFEFLRSCCFSKRYEGFRIKNRKLRGVFSEGIVFKIATIEALDGLPAQKIKEGLGVADLIGIRKYDPDEFRSIDKKVMNPMTKYFMRYKWFRKLILKKRPVYSYPEGMSKANENNIQVVFNKITNLAKVYYRSEKVEGAAASYLINKNKFKVFSHNQGYPKTNNNWWNVAIKYDIETKMKEFMKLQGLKSLFIQGEIAGPGIQRNIYKFNDLKFFIYDVGTLEKGKFSYEDIQMFCNTVALRSVPILKTNVSLLSISDDIVKDADGQSVLNKDVLREGVVWRSMDNSIGFKSKSQKYQVWWNRLKKTI